MSFCLDLYKGVTLLIKSNTRDSEGAKETSYTRSDNVKGLIMPSTGKISAEVFGVTDYANELIFTPNARNSNLIDNGHVLVGSEPYTIKRVMQYGPKQMVLLSPYVGVINIVEE